MRHLLETEYNMVAAGSSSSNSNQARSTMNSRLEEDFDYQEEEDVDELERYLSEKPANKDMDVLAWWKVILVHYRD